MNVAARRLRLLVGFIAACGFGFAILLGLARGALGVGVSSATVPLAGSFDRAFGNGGIVTQSPGSRIGGIAVQPDGKIVVVATGGSIVRYLPDGSPDSSFGDGGSVAASIFAEAVALQPDGKIVVAGASGIPYGPGAEFAVARYNQDGSPDASFGTNGITTTSIPEQSCCGGASWARATALAILPGGDILAAGTAWWDGGDTSPNSQFALVRYTADGSLDPTFGDAGIVQTEFFGKDGLSGIAVQSDGKIVASGSAEICCHGGLDAASMALARYEPDGSPDASFGYAGKVTIDSNNPNVYYLGGPVILDGGKFLVAGAVSKNGDTWSPVLARVGMEGVDAFARIRHHTGTPNAMLAQNDGKILLAVSGSVVRLLPDGRLDTSFGKKGNVSFGDQVSTIALQPDRKILVGAGALARLLGGNNCVVPRLRATTVSRANATLARSYCRRGRIAKRFSSQVTRGRVISTTPPRGTRHPAGARVDLVVSMGKRP